jgi:hypothetical protein
MVEKSFDIHAILFYIASIATKSKREEDLYLEEPIVTQPPPGLISLPDLHLSGIPKNVDF